MKKKQEFQKISQLWITPFLIGVLLSSGYTITKKLLTNKIVSQNTHKNVENKKNNQNKISEELKPSPNNATFPSPKKEINKFDQIQRKRAHNIDANKTSPSTAERNVSSIKEKPSTNKKRNLTSNQNKPINEVKIPKDSKDFFKNHNIDDLFRRLPIAF